MNRKEKATALIEGLERQYPEALCALESGGDPFKLLVMAMLSAQCTDARVNAVSVGLFARFPDVSAMAAADEGEIEELIRSCGLFRTKAADIRATARRLLEVYDGSVPSDMEALLSLPGVGRKIANLIRGDVFGLGGIVADTHCIRLCGRFGFCEEGMRDPLKVERILSEVIPTEAQSDFCHRLVLFGRDVCRARDPDCGACPLSHLCARQGKKPEEKA